MKRRFAGFLSLLSGLLCIATIALWIRSYFGSDYISRRTLVDSQTHSVSYQGHSITFTRGSIRLVWENSTYISHQIALNLHPLDGVGHWSYGRLGVGHVYWGDLEVRSFWNRLGFHRFQDGLSSSFSEEMQEGIAFPAWLPALLFAILPAVWMRRVIRNRRRRQIGLCPRCGYDLRATPTQCPECGHAV